ncbi:hypothetical protein HWV23_07775 [Natronomonas halophila]|uniref:DUF7266 family protein n=1 Tax=Natronomonas halophila TaxID=2747817 RepID=UPI0015B4B9D8|nr:hypothetical protein [Natronomonas halophila]QLD85627.1 hypothetical protein HWV23_07775 [Natronomonas halophila]
MAGIDAERGLSPAVNFVLVTGISLLLIGSLFTGISGVLEDRREAAVDDGLEVTGHQLAADIAAADRAAQTAGEGHITVESRLPTRIAGTRYSVEIRRDGSSVVLLLRSDDPAATARTTVNNETAIETGTYNGGAIRLDWSGDTIEVNDV